MQRERNRENQGILEVNFFLKKHFKMDKILARITKKKINRRDKLSICVVRRISLYTKQTLKGQES